MTSTLQVESLAISFGGLNVLQDVSFEVAPQEILGLIGPNGAGKTTLVNAMTGIVKVDSGRICLDGKPLRRWSLGRAARAGVARTFQTNRVFKPWTVRENLEVARRIAGSAVDPEELLERCGLSNFAHRPADGLSHGDERKLGIALALATDPRIVLLDEPAVGMTSAEVDRLAALIHDLRQGGLTVLVIDHNMGFVMGTCDRLVVLDGGRIIAEGVPDEIKSSPAVIEAYLGGGGHASH